MNMRPFAIAAVSLTLLLSVNASAQRRAVPPAYPWHFIDIWWNSPRATKTFDELSIDFRILDEVPDSVDLYIAPLGLTKIGATALYGGIQTNAGGWPSKADQRIEGIGRGGIFSRWSVNNRKIPLDYARGPAGTHFESADYEDNFISVRRKVDWHTGSYTYLLRRTQAQPADAPFMWFTASVRDNSNGRETEIGSLRFDGPNFSLDREIAAFIEVYGSTSVIPQVTIAISEPRVNGNYRTGTRVRANYPDNATKNKPRFATAIKTGREIIVTLRPRGVLDKVTEEDFK